METQNNVYLKNLLSTAQGTEGSLLIQRTIYPSLIDEYMKILIPRSEAAIVIDASSIPGSSIDLNLVTVNKLKAREIAEGAEIFLDQTEYTSSNLKPVKYGVGIKITKEMLEDAKWDLLKHNVMIAGRRMAENENTLVVAALDGAGNTVSGGASVTLANVIRAGQYLRDADASPTTLFVGNEVLSDLQNMDSFQKVNYAGTDETLRRGIVGQIFGMTVIGPISTNAGMTTTTAYVTDRDFAYVIAEKRPVTVENYDILSHDLSAVAITQRITTATLRSSAIAKITSS